MDLPALLAQRLKLTQRSVAAVLELLDQDHTIPFLARYRKEATGNLDEVELLAIRDERDRVLEFHRRRAAIAASLRENGHWNGELEGRLLACATLAALEDVFLPYRPKRKTRASVAEERGLGPLADRLWANQQPSPPELETFVSVAKGVVDPDAALAGAMDIVAERLSESEAVRGRLRQRFEREARLEVSQARGAEPGNAFVRHVGQAEPLSVVPGHRLLAILRGEMEKCLSLRVVIDSETAVRDLLAAAFPALSPVPALSCAAQDSFHRLLSPSLGREILQKAREKAEAGAIHVFAENLRQLLLAAPLGQKSLLAVDPGLRTGCKFAILSAQGDLLENGVIYPFESRRQAEAEKVVREAATRLSLEAVAVGNGTGGREAHAWLDSLSLGIPVFSVNESGASVYSASEGAREEFPDHDLTVRGAVSIGRRLMDPLAELVKIDPKSIGVGQYQHDVDQKALKRSLDDVVVSCVNRVGVDVNLASQPILTYVAGLGPRLAAAIVKHRVQHGPFRRRQQLLEVNGVGPKAYEQAAGFLRVHGENPLDASSVHPERYPVVERLAEKAGSTVGALIGRRDLASVATAEGLGVGEATFRDILEELEKPGRDPRPLLAATVYDESVRSMDDLREGQVLQGVVTNVTDFGAFVDIGVHQDGLVHVSQLASHFVKNPLDVVKPGQSLKVMVLAVDKEKRRISLSRKACL